MIIFLTAILLAGCIFIYPRLRMAMTRRFSEASSRMLKEAHSLLDDGTLPEEIHQTVEVVSRTAHTREFLLSMAFAVGPRRDGEGRDQFMNIYGRMTKSQKKSFGNFADAAFRVALFSRVWGYYLALPRLIWLQYIRLQISPRPVVRMSEYDPHNMRPGATA